MSVDFLTVIDDIACRGRIDSDDGSADRGFARTGFSDDTESLSSVNLEIDMIDSGKGVSAGTKLNRQISYI